MLVYASLVNSLVKKGIQQHFCVTTESEKVNIIYNSNYSIRKYD